MSTPTPSKKNEWVNKWFLLTLSLKPFKSQIKGKHSSGEIAVQGPDKNLRVLGQKNLKCLGEWHKSEFLRKHPWRSTI